MASTDGLHLEEPDVHGTLQTAASNNLQYHIV